MNRTSLRLLSLVLVAIVLMLSYDFFLRYFQNVWLWFSSTSPKALWVFVSGLILLLFVKAFDFSQLIIPRTSQAPNAFDDVSHTQTLMRDQQYQEIVIRLLKKYLWQQSLEHRVSESLAFNSMSTLLSKSLFEKLKRCLKSDASVTLTKDEFLEFMELINNE